MLKTGDKAPDFTLPDQFGAERSLSEFAERKVVLYFYPKDNTSGCTTEAKEFAALYERFSELGAVIIGISKDSVKSHRNFAEKYRLPFILLSDEEKSVIALYDVLKEKKMYGKTVTGVSRTTFVIDENGVIKDIFSNVKAAGHAGEVYCTLGGNS